MNDEPYKYFGAEGDFLQNNISGENLFSQGSLILFSRGSQPHFMPWREDAEAYEMWFKANLVIRKWNAGIQSFDHFFNKCKCSHIAWGSFSIL